MFALLLPVFPVRAAQVVRLFSLVLLAVLVTPAPCLADDLSEGLDLLRAEQFERALEIFEPLHASDPTNAEVANGLAVALHRTGDGDAAQQVLDTMLRGHPVAGPIYANLQAIRVHSASEAFAAATGWAREVDDPNLVIIEARPAPALPVAVAAPAPEAPPEPVPATPTEAVVVAQPAPDPAAVTARLNQFVSAWSAGDANGYVNFFRPNYVPDVPALHAEWVATRQRLVRPDKDIQVEVSNLRIEPQDDGTVLTRFRQAYSSSTYADVVDKVLRWSYIADRWVIVSETSEAL